MFDAWQAAKEASRKELEAAKQELRTLRGEPFVPQVMREKSSRYDVRMKLLEAEKEALEKKLAWYEAPHDEESFKAIREQASHRDSLAACTIYIGHLERRVKELTKLEAAARQQGFEEGFVAPNDSLLLEAFEQGKQAGRDKLMAEVARLKEGYGQFRISDRAEEIIDELLSSTTSADKWMAEQIVAAKCEALEEVDDYCQYALQSDLENGVKWLNEEAAKEFFKNYPEIADALGKAGRMEEELEVNDAQTRSSQY
jgi:hypothetical protein